MMLSNRKVHSVKRSVFSWAYSLDYILKFAEFISQVQIIQMNSRLSYSSTLLIKLCLGKAFVQLAKTI